LVRRRSRSRSPQQGQRTLPYRERGPQDGKGRRGRGDTN
jgi:hypothetical protein